MTIDPRVEDLAVPTGGWFHPWSNVFGLASTLPTEAWTLVGGLMVQVHALVRGIDVIRPTELPLEEDKEFTARMTAGFCWPWSEPERDGRLVPDVVIGPWQRPWNVKGERAVGGAPPSALWATDPAGFGQVGCISTAQRFEHDWNGVIIGPDLVWRTDRCIARRAESRDPAFRNSSKVTDEEFDRMNRNVYKVLMTRGIIGTLLFSTDAETNTFLCSLI